MLCIGHLGEMIEAHYGDGSDWGIELSYSYDGPRQLGTGGALRQAMPLLGGNMMGFESSHRFYEIGSHAGLAEIGAFLAQQSDSNH